MSVGFDSHLNSPICEPVLQLNSQNDTFKVEKKSTENEKIKKIFNDRSEEWVLLVHVNV